MKKAIVAMSGGVDSSVAAKILIDSGFDCMGATMQLNASGDKYAAEDAKSVAKKLNIPFTLLDFTKEFTKEVIDRFIESYELGDTPNPCIDCNKYIKWDLLIKYMKDNGFDYIATGHYAQIEFDEESGLYKLKKGLDQSKDQSYVLYNMTQDILSHTLLPLGNLSKAEARDIASKNGFINAEKKDSQDICFIPDGDYARFIEEYTGKTYEKGNFVYKDGTILGTHNGIIRYTIGQRKGLGLALKAPAYVCRKCMETNSVILGENDDLFTKTLIASEFNWISGISPTSELCVKAKTRYKHKEQLAIANVLPNGDVKIVFDEPQRAITTGQSVVLYDGDTVLGGGKITQVECNV